MASSSTQLLAHAPFFPVQSVGIAIPLPSLPVRRKPPLSSSSLSMSSSYEMGGVFKRLIPGGVCATNRAPGHGGATRVCDARS